MNNKNEQKILESIKQILSIYKIDFDTCLPDSFEQDSNTPVDFNAIIQKTQEKIEELDKKTSEILEKTGMTEEQMQAYSQNQDNFSPEEWRALESMRVACEGYKKETEELLKQIDSDLSPSKLVPPSISKKSGKKGKKRNWIPM